MVATTTDIIRKTPGVMGGEACLGLHRIAVWQVVEMRQQGSTDEWMKENFDELTQEELNAAWDYYAKHREVIDAVIRFQNSDDT